MNARNYRVGFNISPLDFPAIKGLGESTLSYQSEPHLHNDKILLNIIKKYILTDDNNTEHEVLSVQSVYEIPTNEIKTREDVYDFYKDATLSLNEAYQYARTQLPTLFNIILPTLPIEQYQIEIDRIFSLLNTQN